MLRTKTNITLLIVVVGLAFMLSYSFENRLSSVLSKNMVAFTMNR